MTIFVNIVKYPKIQIQNTLFQKLKELDGNMIKSLVNFIKECNIEF